MIFCQRFFELNSWSLSVNLSVCIFPLWNFCCLNLLITLLDQIEARLSLRNLLKFKWFVPRSWLLWKDKFSCWFLFNTETVFSLFEMSFELLVEVSVVIRIIWSTSLSCKCFIFYFLFFCSSFTFRSYL